MRTPPDDKSDKADLKRMNAEPWMIKLLKKNPSYVFWGPHEDYMMKKDAGWETPAFHKTWKDFGPWELNELNELVNFYFQISRDSKNCDACDGSGQNPETHAIAESFYDHQSPTGKGWHDAITQDEVEALQKEHRLVVRGKLPSGEEGWIKKEGLTAEEVNKANGRGAPGLGNFNHDAINRWILIETRAKRLGVYGKCKVCKGHGDIHTSDHAKVSLVLWFIHPRKGCSRGVEIDSITEAELSEVFSYLKEAKKRNAQRFAKVG